MTLKMSEKLSAGANSHFSQHLQPPTETQCSSFRRLECRWIDGWREGRWDQGVERLGQRAALN